MSYMVREALAKMYPDIFKYANRHIRKPRTPKPIQPQTHILHSYVDGSIKILDRIE